MACPDQALDVLNFMVVGNHHSGYGMMQASLAAHPKIVCHGDVLHDDDEVRKREHEDYFGPCETVIDHFLPTHISAEQYLNNKIFDRNLRGEIGVGVKVCYQHLLRYDLFDFARQKSRQGDFCLVHIVRNPVACLVAWKRRNVATNGFVPESVYLDPEETTEFVRNHVAANLKIDQACRDRLVIQYHELLLNFRAVLVQACKFLDIEFSPACIPNQKQVRRRDVKARVANWEQLRESVPADVKAFFDSPTLY